MHEPFGSVWSCHNCCLCVKQTYLRFNGSFNDFKVWQGATLVDFEWMHPGPLIRFWKNDHVWDLIKTNTTPFLFDGGIHAWIHRDVIAIFHYSQKWSSLLERERVETLTRLLTQITLKGETSNDFSHSPHGEKRRLSDRSFSPYSRGTITRKKVALMGFQYPTGRTILKYPSSLLLIPQKTRTPHIAYKLRYICLYYVILGGDRERRKASFPLCYGCSIAGQPPFLISWHD